MSDYMAALARAAVLTVLVIPALSACADGQRFAADEGYYANPTNPVPELSGHKIRRSDVEVIANAVNPHPELMGFPDVEVANGRSGSSSK